MPQGILKGIPSGFDFAPPEAPPFDLIVSIVHHDTPLLLERCLESLRREGSRLRVKIAVVDNASRNGPEKLRALHPEVDFIFNSDNVGFGRANNQVFRRWAARAYLVTNPDIVVAPGSLSRLMEELAARPQAGALGVKLLYPDGRPQASCRRYPTLRSVLLRGFLPESRAARFQSIRRYLMRDADLERPGPVDWVMGSCLLLRAEALRAVGGFDEDFFMYYEDIDLCYRLGRAGWSVDYVPQVEWIHDYRRQSARPGQWKLRAAHLRSALRFLAKHAWERGIYASF
ncbi:MAG: glycosyltransferase family 2 protein [Elusimicrobiota bacterium]